MRTKEDMLKDLGVNAEYSAHGGIPADTKEVILIEAVIDIRDIIDLRLCQMIDRIAAIIKKD